MTLYSCGSWHPGLSPHPTSLHRVHAAFSLSLYMGFPPQVCQQIFSLHVNTSVTHYSHLPVILPPFTGTHTVFLPYMCAHIPMAFSPHMCVHPHMVFHTCVSTPARSFLHTCVLTPIGSYLHIHAQLHHLFLSSMCPCVLFANGESNSIRARPCLIYLGKDF